MPDSVCLLCVGLQDLAAIQRSKDPDASALRAEKIDRFRREKELKAKLQVPYLRDQAAWFDVRVLIGDTSRVLAASGVARAKES